MHPSFPEWSSFMAILSLKILWNCPGRIGLDTGAYRSGILSAMAFEGAKRWIIQEKFGTVLGVVDKA